MTSIIADGTLAFGLQLPIQSQSTIYAEPWEASAGFFFWIPLPGGQTGRVPVGMVREEDVLGVGIERDRSRVAQSGRVGGLVAAVGIVLATIIGFTMGGLNYVVTVLQARTRGMTRVLRASPVATV